MDKKDKQLDGHDNKRISDYKPTDNEGTAAWANEAKKQDVTNVSIPSEDNVKDAKKWVDNGSRL